MDKTKELLAETKKLFTADLTVLRQLEKLEKRLEEPLRIALVGSLKAGKSTLLNGLLGERVAPTDSRECTKIVTWYHHGNVPRVTGVLKNSDTVSLPARRQTGRLELDLQNIPADEFSQLDVTWPAPGNEGIILIDTPGTASISQDVSSQTDEFLFSEDGADAVIYLLRSLHESDIKYMQAIHEHSRHNNSAMAAIAVLSRADELASGRLTAMLSINDAVDKLRNDNELKKVCETIVPVAGLLGMGAMTLTQKEFNTFRKLAAQEPETTHKLLITAERFITSKLEFLPDEQTRISLVDRFGMYGIRLAIATIRGGAVTADELSLELMRRSGLEELRRVIDVFFKQRQKEIKEYSINRALYNILNSNRVPAAEEVLVRVDQQLNTAHTFNEMKTVGQINSRQISLPVAQITKLEYLLGGRGLDPATRLGMSAGKPAEKMLAQAAKELKLWREIEDNPLLDADTWRAAQTAVKSCEILITNLLEKEKI